MRYRVALGVPAGAGGLRRRAPSGTGVASAGTRRYAHRDGVRPVT